jgi:hypothetical protein
LYNERASPVFELAASRLQECHGCQKQQQPHQQQQQQPQQPQQRWCLLLQLCLVCVAAGMGAVVVTLPPAG